MLKSLKEKILYGNKWLIGVNTYEDLKKIERRWLYKSLYEKKY